MDGPGEEPDCPWRVSFSHYGILMSMLKCEKESLLQGVSQHQAESKLWVNSLKVLQFTKGGCHFDMLSGTFLQLLILFFQPSPLSWLVRIARIRDPGCFTKGAVHLMHYQIDDDDEDNEVMRWWSWWWPKDNVMMMIMMVMMMIDGAAAAESPGNEQRTEWMMLIMWWWWWWLWWWCDYDDVKVGTVSKMSQTACQNDTLLL